MIWCFFLSNIFNDSEPYSIDLLPDALIRLNKEIRPEHIEQFQVVITKAYQVVNYGLFWHSLHYRTKDLEDTFFVSSVYDNLIALFIIHYGLYLLKKFPKESAYIKELHDSYAPEKSGWQTVTGKFSTMKDWVGKEYPVFYTYHQVMIKALSIITKEVDLPLLSTPTHKPSWISANVLNDRILQYQKAKADIDKADLQLALSRCKPQEAHLLSQQKQELPFYSNYSWTFSGEKQKDKNWVEHYKLIINIPKTVKKIFSKKQTDLYSDIDYNIRYCLGPLDIQRFICMYPSTPDIPFALLTSDRFAFAQMDAAARDMALNGIETLWQLKIPVTEMTALFLSCCLLCSESNVRNFAAEIWTERINADLLDPSELGQIIGRLENAEWAPLKRLTDFIMGNLSVTTKHNLAFEKMIIALLLQIDKPIMNIKKLLEIYKELLVLNKSAVDVPISSKLESWQSENSLKKIVNELKVKN